MHELGLCDAIVAAAVRRARGRQVASMRVRVTGHPVDPEFVRQALQLAAAGTVAEGASVELAAEPVTVHCRDCGARTPAYDALALAACPACGGVDVAVPEGGDVTIESISFGTPERGSAPKRGLQAGAPGTGST